MKQTQKPTTNAHGMEAAWTLTWESLLQGLGTWYMAGLHC